MVCLTSVQSPIIAMLQYCKPKYFSNFTIIAIIATQGKTPLKLNSIFLIALYAIYKLERNR